MDFPCIIIQVFLFSPNISLFLSLSIALLEGQRRNTSIDHFKSLSSKVLLYVKLNHYSY